MRIYIVGEKRDEKEYERVEKILREEGHEVFNYIKVLKALPPMLNEDVVKLKHAMILISEAVFVVGNWKNRYTAEEEIYYAIKNNRNVIFDQQNEIPFY